MARDLLHGNASTFGILLGATGVGAVTGALAVSKVREYFGAEQAVRLCILVSSPAVVLMGFSHHLLLPCALMFISGAANMLLDRKSTRLKSSPYCAYSIPSSACNKHTLIT